MKVKELFEAVKRKPGDTYSDDELKAQQDERLKRKTAAQSQLINLLKTKCKKNFTALVNGTSSILYRSTNMPNYVKLGDYVFADITGRTEPRRSKTGSNLFMNYASQSHDWAGYPKREISNSATPDYSAAKQFGGVCWLIIPYDDVGPFARCKGDFNYIDLGDGTEGMIDRLSIIDNVILTAQNVLKSKSKELRALGPKIFSLVDSRILKFVPERHRYSIEEIEQLSDTIEKLIYEFDEIGSQTYKDVRNIVSLKEALDYFEDEFNTRSLDEWLSEHIAPKALGIKLFDSYPGMKIPKNSEVWFEGSYVAIAADPGGYEETDKLVSSEWFKGIAKQV
jgi:hypothetical protein